MNDAALRRASWALLAGNFAIGCGVMVVAGSLNDLMRSLQVSVATAGQLITVAALAMSLGAPLLAALCACGAAQAAPVFTTGATSTPTDTPAPMTSRATPSQNLMPWTTVSEAVPI